MLRTSTSAGKVWLSVGGALSLILTEGLIQIKHFIIACYELMINNKYVKYVEITICKLWPEFLA